MSWTYVRALTIDSSQVGSSDLSDFPVLVNVTDSTLADTSNGGHIAHTSTGFGNVRPLDLAFYSDSALTTLLDFECEPYGYDPTTGRVIAWVRIPSLSHTTDTVIYMAYGDATGTDQSNPHSVWDSSFKGVYHLAPAGLGVPADSTGNGNDASAYTATASTSGQIGKCVSFSNAGTAQYIEIPGTMGSPASVTIELWAKSTLATDTSYSPTLVDISNGPSIRLQHLSGSAFTSDFVIGTIATHGVSKQGDYTHDAGWHHYVYTWTNGSQIMYVDGVSAGTASFAVSPFYGGGTGKTRIGAEASNSTPTSSPFTGSIDEIRFSSVIRSADWIAASYANQSDPSSFMSIGAEGSTDPRTEPIIDWSDPSDLTYPSSTLSSTQLNAVEHNSVAGSFSYSPASGTTLDAGNSQVLSVTFSPTDTVTYKPVTKTVHINVLKGATSLTFSDPTPADIDNPTALSSSQLNASEDHSIAGTIVYTTGATVLSSGSVLPAGTYTILATFTPTDDNYEISTASVTLVVHPNPAAPSVPVYIQGKAGTVNGSSPLSFTFDDDVTLGSTIIIQMAHNYLGCSPSGCVDTLGNHYDRVGSGKNPGSSQFFWGFVGKVTTGGPCTVTVSYGCGISRWSFATVWAGLDDDPYDGDNVATTSTPASTSGSVTTTANGDLVLSCWAGDAAPEWTAGSGTIILTCDHDALQWEIQDTAGAIAPTATGTGVGATYHGHGSTMAFRAAPAASHDYTQDLSDSITVAEAIHRATGKKALDTFSLTELIHRAIGTSRADSITVTELLHRDTTRPLLESISTSDSLLRATGTAKSDSIPVTDFITKASRRSFLDNFSLSEIFAAMRGKLLTLMDSLSLGDSISRATDRAIVEALALSETVTRVTSRAYVEALSIIDHTTRSVGKAYTESVTLLDSISRSVTKKLADAFRLSETFSVLYVLLIHFTDSISLNDSISKATGKVYTDAVSISDSLKRGISRAFVEVLSLLDLVTTLKSRGIAFVDSLELADSLGGRVITKALRETLSLVETTGKAVSRSFRDTITLVDSVTATFHRFVAAVREIAAEILQRIWQSDYRVRLWSADEQPQRTFQFHGVETMIHTTKDQDAIEDFEIDFADAIGEDPIQTAVWTVPTGVTLGATSHTDTSTKARISSGTLGKSYQVECAVTLLSSQVKVQRISILISPNGDYETQ